MSEPLRPIEAIIAEEIVCREDQVRAAVALLDEGATVPFIARYRKEVTGGLDDTQLRSLEERLRYLRELAERRGVILNSIAEQGKLTPELEAALLAADSKTRLEDLYLPFKPKRRTKAQMAREAGLEPLADLLWNEPEHDPVAAAEAFLNPEHKVLTGKDALDGARQIWMERLAENADLLTRLRTWLWEHALIESRVADGQADPASKYRDYFDHTEALAEIPSHRVLALLRGRKEGVLRVSMILPEAMEQAQPHPCEAMIAAHAGWRHQNRAADDWLKETWRWTWRVKLALHLETELLGRVRELAETAAIGVFARNLKALLMAPPAGMRTTLGLDPGLRTGVKAVVVDPTGKLLATETVFPHAPQKRWDVALATLGALCLRHRVQLIAIGNGTASRETDKLAAELLRKLPDLRMQKMVVNEAGASVYSASELAAREFPELDVSYRGAVSIARRLQDPLAELVKIDPGSIGVGQYQHDVSQVQLARSLDAVVEDCVNGVGVDVNTASVPLLARIAGLNSSLAENIVSYREQNGAFPSRKVLLKVPRLGAKTFEQAGGFLRIMNGADPLDSSAVHPEAYVVVERIAARHRRSLADLIGDSSFLRTLKPADYTCERFGVPTVKDIIAELEKPGRDPRPEFRAATFRDGVEDLKDLQPDMVLEGTVTNVTNFGAFVDIGVHQDGLVHISALADRFVKDPHEVVAPGDIVRVKVIEVDLERRRVALTMRLQDAAAQHQAETLGGSQGRGQNQSQTSGRGQSHGSGRGQGPGSGRGQGQSSGRGQGQGPGRSPSQGSERGQGQGSGRSQGRGDRTSPTAKPSAGQADKAPEARATGGMAALFAAAQEEQAQRKKRR